MPEFYAVSKFVHVFDEALLRIAAVRTIHPNGGAPGDDFEGLPVGVALQPFFNKTEKSPPGCEYMPNFTCEKGWPETLVSYGDDDKAWLLHKQDTQGAAFMARDDFYSLTKLIRIDDMRALRRATARKLRTLRTAITLEEALDVFFDPWDSPPGCIVLRNYGCIEIVFGVDDAPVAVNDNA